MPSLRSFPLPAKALCISKKGEHIYSPILSNNIWVCLPQHMGLPATDEGLELFGKRVSSVVGYGGFSKIFAITSKDYSSFIAICLAISSISFCPKILLLNNAHPSSLGIFPCLSRRSLLVRDKFMHFFLV